jgi:manganese efflux pump family protein
VAPGPLAARLTRLAGLAVAVGLLAPVTGCGRQSEPAARAASLPGCTTAGVRAIQRRVTLTTLPAACRGLPPADLERAAVTAIDLATDHARKARRRKLAAAASTRLSYLLTVAERAQARSARSRHHRPVTEASQPSGFAVPAGLAALVAWLLTAAAGGYLLAGWLKQSGSRRDPIRHYGRPPVVVLSHAGLALTGLLIWIGFLISGWVPAAWAAACLLLLVAGLGMASLAQAISGASPPGQEAPVTTQAGRPVTARTRPPAVIIAVHGVCATAAMLLVLLAAIAAR